MPQPKSRGRGQLITVGRDRDRRVTRRDPIFQEVLGEDGLDLPGALAALEAIEDMRSWGVDVTIEIARNCLHTHMIKHKRMSIYDAEQDARAQERRHPPIVYYMRLASLIKIGWTTNLTKRLEVIHPEEVMATEPGDRTRERERHEQFAAQHAHGEWFRLEAPLTNHIEALRRDAAGE